MYDFKIGNDEFLRTLKFPNFEYLSGKNIN